MRPLDVEIVDRPLQSYPFHTFDDLAAVGTEAGHPLHGYVENRTYPLHDLYRRSVILAIRLVTPARSAFLRPSNTQPQALQRMMSLIVASDHRDPVHRRPATPVPTERHHHVPATPRIALRHIMGCVRTQPGIGEQPMTALRSLDLRENLVDQILVGHETVVRARTRHERQRRHLVLER